MTNNLLNGLKGTGIFLGILFYLISYIPYKIGVYLLTVKFSTEITAEKAAKEAEEARKKVVKKRAPHKKKVVETIATEVNN